jgi:hypothetical protein
MKGATVALLAVVCTRFGLGQATTSGGKTVGTATQSTAPAAVQVVVGADNRYCDASGTWLGSRKDGVAELPRTCVYTALAATPSPGSTVAAHDVAGLTSALGALQCGQTISLDAGVTYNGNFTLPAKGCDNGHWITIKTAGTIPAEGTRITPCYANVASLAGRPAYSCATPSAQMAKVVGTGGSAVPFTLAENADHYRLIGLEITRPSDNTTQGTLILGGNQASRIIIDRCWVHGVATAETRRGVWTSGWTYAAVIDSYFTDFHCNQNGACGDSQAIAGGTGNYASGPLKIANNFLESAAEGTIFGGDVGTTVPVDLEFRRNHYWKPFQWQPGNAGYVAGTSGSGGSMIVKNHFELKNAIRTLFEGNLLENVWGGFSQQAYPFTITPVNQSSGCAVCNVSDTVIRYNKSGHSGGGMVWSPNAAGAAGGAASRRLVFHDNVMEDIDHAKYNANGVEFFLANSWPDNNWGDTDVEHNTAFLNTSLQYPHAVYLDHDLQYGNLTGLFNFSNNLYTGTGYPWWASLGVGTGCGNSDNPIAMLNACFPNGWTSTNNVVVGVGSPYNTAAHWPANTTLPAAWADVQLMNYNNGNGGDYRLAGSSPQKWKGSDGRDPGADVDAVNGAVTGVN